MPLAGLAAADLVAASERVLRLVERPCRFAARLAFFVFEGQLVVFDGAFKREIARNAVSAGDLVAGLLQFDSSDCRAPLAVEVGFFSGVGRSECCDCESAQRG